MSKPAIHGCVTPEAHQAWHDYAALEANLKGHRLIYIETDMANHGVSVTAIALPRAQCQCGLWMHARNTTLLAELYAHHIGQVMHKAHYDESVKP